jgi:hypothetical protein
VWEDSANGDASGADNADANLIRQVDYLHDFVAAVESSGVAGRRAGQLI